MSFLAEHAPPGRRGFVGSWSASSVVLGSLLGSGIAAACSGLLSESDLHTWGWRVPFLGGISIGVVGLWLRLGVEETPSFLQIKKSGLLAANPVSETVRRDLWRIVMTVGLTALSSVGYYLPFLWLPTWLAQINRPPLPESQALTANTIALVALLLLTPFTALLSDRVGRRPMYLISALGYALLSYPLFVLMSGGTLVTAVIGGLAFAGVNSAFSGCMAATMVELFPTRTRYTGVAIGYNLAQTLLGGTAPGVATGLIYLTGDKLAPTYYLILCGVVTGLFSLFIKPRHGHPLE
jgi:MHS family proline/betaine transporter-like MFS transporter